MSGLTDTACLHEPPEPERVHTLERFAAAAARADGVSLAELAPIDELEVRTRNSRYRITLLSARDSRILVQGGAFFPVACEARLNGGSMGGSVLRLGWIGLGFCMEIQRDGLRIITSRVREIRRVNEPVALSAAH